MTAGTRRTTNRTTSQPATSRNRARAAAVSQRHDDPMPRSTTRVVWTISQGAVVEFGEIS